MTSDHLAFVRGHCNIPTIKDLDLDENINKEDNLTIKKTENPELKILIRDAYRKFH